MTVTVSGNLQNTASNKGSILGPVLFNIFLYHLFFIIDDVDVASYPDDNTSYTQKISK